MGRWDEAGACLAQAMSKNTTDPDRGAPNSGQIQISHLTKQFGSATVVNDLSFTVQPGRITGFLGPNGAGKTTTLRMLLGLVQPTSGSATISGKRYVHTHDSITKVGAALEATGFHPGRTGRNHLRVVAATAGIHKNRVDEVLDLVGLTKAARTRVGKYSLGMRQRLGLATALLGNPDVLILDEPANGLDPEGIRWLRGFLRHQAETGAAVLVSSHLLQEVQQTVDDVVIINHGRLVRQGPVEELSGGAQAYVRTSDPSKLATALQRARLTATIAGESSLVVPTDQLQLIGDVALSVKVPIWELREHSSDLEALYFDLTSDSSKTPPPAGPPVPTPTEDQMHYLEVPA